MLPKAARLSAPEVRNLIKTGRSARVDGLSAKYKAADTPKAAVVVSKKVAPRAVERNALRRLVYAHLPDPLPRAHMVLFVQSAQFDLKELTKLCSQLS